MLRRPPSGSRSQSRGFVRSATAAGAHPAYRRSAARRSNGSSRRGCRRGRGRPLRPVGTEGRHHQRHQPDDNEDQSPANRRSPRRNAARPDGHGEWLARAGAGIGWLLTDAVFHPDLQQDGVTDAGAAPTEIVPEFVTVEREVPVLEPVDVLLVTGRLCGQTAPRPTIVVGAPRRAEVEIRAGSSSSATAPSCSSRGRSSARFVTPSSSSSSRCWSRCS